MTWKRSEEREKLDENRFGFFSGVLTKLFSAISIRSKLQLKGITRLGFLSCYMGSVECALMSSLFVFPKPVSFLPLVY